MIRKMIAGLIVAVGLVMVSAPPAMAQDSPGFLDRLFGRGRALVDKEKAVGVAGIEATNAAEIANVRATNAVDVAKIEAEAGQRIAEIDQRAREAIARAENDASLVLADKQARIEEIKAMAGKQMEEARAGADVAIAEADAKARMYLSDNRVAIVGLEGETALALADKEKENVAVKGAVVLLIILAVGLVIVSITGMFRRPRRESDLDPVRVLPMPRDYPRLTVPDSVMLADDLTDGFTHGGVLYLPAQTVSVGDD